jgi:hypothetical protein
MIPTRRCRGTPVALSIIELVATLIRRSLALRDTPG